MSRYYDPCSKSRVVKWRWKIAGWLNRSKRTCWANIVSWALGARPMFDRSGNEDDIRRTAMCFQPGDERCYCGKFANPLTPQPDHDDAAAVDGGARPSSVARHEQSSEQGT